MSDAIILRALGIREEAIVSMVMATLLLKEAASRGFNLASIAMMVQRVGANEEPSFLECIIASVVFEELETVPLDLTRLQRTIAAALCEKSLNSSTSLGASASSTIEGKLVLNLDTGSTADALSANWLQLIQLHPAQSVFVIVILPAKETAPSSSTSRTLVRFC
jgi:hypothetical protein